MAIGDGTGRTKIQMYKNDRVTLHNERTLEFEELSDLCQVTSDPVLDTDSILVMDDGSTKKIIKGHRVRVLVPIIYIQFQHSVFWKTFLHDLNLWDEEILITPHIDAPADKYWVYKVHSWTFNKDIHYERFMGTMEFIGCEIICP